MGCDRLFYYAPVLRCPPVAEIQGGGCVGSPANFAVEGMNYDVCAGTKLTQQFIGQSLTAAENLPTVGYARYEGTMRGNVGDVYRTGTANAEVDFYKSEIEFSGDVDFTGSGDLGRYMVRETMTITSNRFSVRPVATIISPDPTNGTFITGHFYGQNAEYIAGSVNDPRFADGAGFSGRFISKQTVIGGR